jgi:hypothetical protein
MPKCSFQLERALFWTERASGLYNRSSPVWVNTGSIMPKRAPRAVPPLCALHSHSAL